MKYLSLVLFAILVFHCAACAQSVKDGNQKIEKISGAAQTSERSVTGKVVEVHDGETITVLDEDARRYRIRLFGIEAPALKQVFGKESKKHLSELIYGETVTVEIIKTGKDDILFGKVRLEGKDINYVQLLFGCARYNQNDRPEQTLEDRQDYTEAETKARQSKRGLWAFARL